jgi:hypothetical protein
VACPPFFVVERETRGRRHGLLFRPVVAHGIKTRKDWHRHEAREDSGLGTSFYYEDPDQNVVELNVNNYGNKWT